MTNKYPGNTTCELCGRIGNHFTNDGWMTCETHVDAERPPRPLFAWNTGEVFDPAVVIRPWEKFLDRPEREQVPPDHGAAD